MGSEKQCAELLEGLLFPKIFRTFRMAIQPSKLIIALSAIAAICLAGWIMDSVTKSVRVTPSTNGQETELNIYLADPDKLDDYIESLPQTAPRTGVFATLWSFARAKFHGALAALFAFDLPLLAANVAEYFRAVEWAMRYHFTYCVIFALIKLAVLSVAGGAICRIAALQCARGEKPGMTEALRFSLKKFTSFFTTPLVPVGIIVFVGMFVVIVGLLGNIPRIGELIVGVLMPLAIVAGTLIAVVLIGTIAGFNLMFPAIAYNGSDSFDAVSRAFNYVYTRPWRMGFYTAVAAVYGAVCYLFVRFFAFALLWSTHWSLRLGLWASSANDKLNKLAAVWPEPSYMKLHTLSNATTNWTESLAAFVIYLLTLIVVGLVVSFILSFYFSANTVIYALMRKKVDNTAIDDIYTDFESGQPQPTTVKTSEQQDADEQEEATKEADSPKPEQ